MHKVLSYSFHSYKHNELFSDAHDKNDSAYFKTSHFPIFSANFGRKMCALPIGHFEKYYNTLCLSPISIVSSFSWELQRPQEKTKTMLMQNFGGQTKSIMVFSEVAYCLNHS